LFHNIDSLCALDIISKEHSEKTKSRKMSKETNTKEFFTPPKRLQKSGVNRQAIDNEDNKITLSGCKHSNAIE
jgi:hypothetical protein